MTPTATVCFMSRTAKRPRGGYWEKDSTTMGLLGTRVTMAESPATVTVSLVQPSQSALCNRQSALRKHHSQPCATVTVSLVQPSQSVLTLGGSQKRWLCAYITSALNPFAFVTPKTVQLTLFPSVRNAQKPPSISYIFSHINNRVLTTVPPQKAGQVKASMPECYTAAAPDVWPSSFMSACSGTDPFLFHSQRKSQH